MFSGFTMSVALRCNVELSLALEGVGLLVGGWVFDPEGELTEMRVSNGDADAVDIAGDLVRSGRPDVLEALAPEYTTRQLARNRNCGFFGFVPGAAFALHKSLQMTLRTTGQSSTVELALAPLSGEIDAEVAAYLKYNLGAVVELLRAQDLLEEPPVATLLGALGPEGLDIRNEDAADDQASGVELAIELCTVVPDLGVIVAGRLGALPERVSSFVLCSGDERVDLLPWLAFAPLRGDEKALGCDFVAAIPRGELGGLPRRQTFEVDIAGAGITTAAAFARTGLASLRHLENRGGDVGLALWELASERWAELGANRAGSFSRAMASVLTASREASPLMFTDRSQGVGGSIDYLYLVPGRGFFVVGWLVDVDGRLQSVQAHWSGGHSQDLLGTMLRLSRMDVVEAFPGWSDSWASDKVGFAAFVDAPAFEPRDADSLYFTFSGDSRMAWRVRSCAPRSPDADPLKQVREILHLVPLREAEPFFLHLGPTIEGIWAARRHPRDREVVHDIGDVPREPDVSVVVPLFGRFDFVEYQMSLFADDRDWESAELIYVVDDPRIADEVLRLCRDRYDLFRVPCRVIACDRNNGFAKANNIGVSHARGRLVLLLNSDVMPRRHGWLAQMVKTYDALDKPGALGAQLLFPDGSVQHAGMRFEQLSRYPRLWLNDHPGKGHPRRPASEPRQVPSVTAACLMIGRELYLEVGGLDEGYILGDFEDSDLCLKLWERGRRSYLAPAVELYHLERQSQNLVGSSQWRSGLTLFNAWRHTVRWDSTIRRVMGEAP